VLAGGCQGTLLYFAAVLHLPRQQRRSARCSRAEFRFSGRTYPQLARIVRALCAITGGCCEPVATAVAVTVAVSRWAWSPSPRSRGAVTAPCPSQAPPPNPTAAEPGDGRVRSRPSSRVREPCSLTAGGCPAVTDGLDGFRESRILLRRVRGRTHTFSPASGRSDTPGDGDDDTSRREARRLANNALTPGE
jgi:hypothetical protein